MLRDNVIACPMMLPVRGSRVGGDEMREHVSVVVFDVNETLSDMTPMGQRFTDLGLGDHLAKLWFASLLRDGFALTASGDLELFGVLGREALRGLLSGEDLDRSLDDAVEHVMAGFAALGVHEDVPEGVRALRAAGLRLVTLTNGSTDVADRLFTQAGIRDEFERLISVEEAGVWKPAPDSYRYASRICDIPLEDMLLVAVHPWDIHGAARAGMHTAWVNRTNAPYPAYFQPPAMTASSLNVLADDLTA
jgi:2-haloacid dehalogenase